MIKQAPYFIRAGLLACLLPLSYTTVANTSPAPVAKHQQTAASFQHWLEDYQQYAISQGIAPQVVKQAFERIQLNERVLELDRRQPEFTQTFWQYFNRAVTRWRIQQGEKLLKKHPRLLHQVTQKYGIPERILIALWGMETNFGGYTGNTPIIESLATLSYDARRSRFFSKELISALRLLEKENIPLSQMKGSWAGAMGQCQFMPSNYLRYAVDANQNGQRDLWQDLPDVFHSMGNFLKTLGWQAGENWGREITLPESFDYALADGKTKRSLNEWRQLGLKLADGRSLPNEEMKAALLLPYDASGPAFLVFKNFFVIKRWNNSNKYALAVGHLADRIVGRPALSKAAPKDDQNLSYAEIREIQNRLNLLGLDAGPADGIIGSRTKTALRQFQSQHGLIADGYPSYKMLKKLRQSNK